MIGVTYDQLKMLISPEGQEAIVEFVRAAREERGQGWIEALKAEYPNFDYVFTLVWENSEQDALEMLKFDFPLLKLGLFDNDLRQLHRKLKFEIERER